ncbi:MAG TPA: hypothetical protein ACFYD7_04345 [Candidatus Wujingus californicus]|uniref:hypothetical protein n=1 Tax=Candidatus Wujingus californicus TaxID=3367618 RepID=UPI001DF30736|nr:hypothetical protein [Planctomycetota bacterium]
MVKSFKLFLLLQFALATLIFSLQPLNAKELIKEGIIKVKRSHLRTPEEMDASEAMLRAEGKIPKAIKIPFRPALNKFEYKAEKDAATATHEPSHIEKETKNTTAPSLKEINVEGVNQNEAGGAYPPDTHGAVGIDQFVEITNQNVDIYEKSTGNRVKSISLASFFGYNEKDLFDPRCVYDHMRDRWIITAEAFPETSTVQYQFIAVSKTSDPLGSFYIYSIDVNYKDRRDFWDFPQLGFDQNAILITGNIFFAEVIPRNAALLVVNKSRLYSGLSLKVKFFSGLKMNVSPPIVLDSSEKTFLIAPQTRGTTITKYTLTYTNRIPALTSSTITVPSYSIPPDAEQPDTDTKLDSSDSRFVNASTQYGDSLWQVHTVNNSGRPSPKFYEFNTANDSVVQSGFFYASSTSHDWNASVTANTVGDAFVTWSSTDPANGTNAQVRFSGRKGTDFTGIISSGDSIFTSSALYNPSSDDVERWGDYSAVTIDPEDSQTAWIVNEKINNKIIWGSRIGQIGF